MSTPLFEPTAIRAALNDDPEFRIQARYWNTQFRIDVTGLQTLLVTIRDGIVTTIDPHATPFDGWSFQLSGTDEQWREMLADIPKPFFQDYYAAMLYHGFKIEGDMELIMSYYPAIRRSLEVFRTVKASEVNA